MVIIFGFLKKHVPIPMCIVKCKHNCCAVKCCPLILAWASTIHRFQGFEAGPGPNDTVKHLLVDPGPGTFEHLALGILYVALGRAKTIGNFQDEGTNYSSSLYWIGSNMCRNRVKQIGMKKDNTKGVALLQREKWVDFLKKQKKITDNVYNEEKVKSMMKTYEAISNATQMTKKELTICITRTLENQNMKDKKTMMPPLYM